MESFSNRPLLSYYGDERIECKDCGRTFIFTGRDRTYFESRSLVPPKRCKSCREARKQLKSKIGDDKFKKVMYGKPKYI